MIPAEQINPRALATLLNYLDREIRQALNDRKFLEEKWARFEKAYKAQPESVNKDFPFVGAANLVIPVIATDVDITFSRLMGLLFAPENLWSIRPLNPVMVEYAPRVQEFLQWAQNAELNAYDATADWLLELCKLGTGVLKQRYTRESKRVYQYRETPEGILEQHLDLLIKDNPVIQHVPLVDFLLPATATSLEDAPWCAERLNLTWGQYANRVASGLYTGMDRLQSWWARDRGSRLEQFRQELDFYAPSFGDKIELWEVWLDFDIGGTGEPQALVCTLHLPSQTYLRIDYNPFLNQEKPYSVARFLRQSKRFLGIGLAEMLDQFQDEISTMHNQRLDNATLANSQMYKARTGSGIRQGEPIFPGRVLLMDNPAEDFVPMPMGQKYDSTVPYEQLTLSYASRRTGVSDYIAGADNPAIGYGTATTAVQMLREGAKRFDQTMREVRRCLSQTGTRVLELYQQFNTQGKEFIVQGPADGAFTHAILAFPIELIRMSLGVELTATSASLNKEVEIRTNQLVMQMLTQFYMQTFQAMQLAFNPQVPPPMQQLALQMAQGGAKLMRRILDSYGIQDAESLIPDLGQVVSANQQQLDSIFSAIPGGAGAAPGAPEGAGMALVPTGAPGNGAAGYQPFATGGAPTGFLQATG